MAVSPVRVFSHRLSNRLIKSLLLTHPEVASDRTTGPGNTGDTRLPWDSRRASGTDQPNSWKSSWPFPYNWSQAQSSSTDPSRVSRTSITEHVGLPEMVWCLSWPKRGETTEQIFHAHGPRHEGATSGKTHGRLGGFRGSMARSTRSLFDESK